MGGKEERSKGGKKEERKNKEGPVPSLGPDKKQWCIGAHEN